MNNNEDKKPTNAGEGKKRSFIEVLHKGERSVMNGPFTCGLSGNRVTLITSNIGEKQIFWGFTVGEVNRSQLAQFAGVQFGQDYEKSILNSAINPDVASLSKAHVVTINSYLSIENQLLALAKRFEESSVVICNCVTVEVLDAALHAIESHEPIEFLGTASPLLSPNQLMNSLKAAKNAF